MARPAHALEADADVARRAYLADEVDVADVDAKLERRRGNADRHVAGLQPLLGVVPRLLRHAAVVRDDLRVAEPFRHEVGNALDQAARVHEQESRAVRPNELRDLVERLGPLLVSRDGPHLEPLRQLDGKVHGPAVARIHDRALGRAPRQEARHLLDGLLGSREPDARDRAFGEAA